MAWVLQAPFLTARLGLRESRPRLGKVGAVYVPSKAPVERPEPTFCGFYTEDFRHGQKLGSLEVRNPFL